MHNEIKQGKIVAKLLPTEARLRDLKAKQSSAKKAKHAKKAKQSPQEAKKRQGGVKKRKLL